MLFSWRCRRRFRLRGKRPYLAAWSVDFVAKSSLVQFSDMHFGEAIDDFGSIKSLEDIGDLDTLNKVCIFY